MEKQTVISLLRLKINSTSAISSFMQKWLICSSKTGFFARQSILKFWRFASTELDDEDTSLILANFKNSILKVYILRDRLRQKGNSTN